MGWWRILALLYQARGLFASNVKNTFYYQKR
nr:MAG TPA: hypothetical protein [Caudoviricetes sp.]